MKHEKKRTLWEDARMIARALGIWREIMPACLPCVILGSIVSCIKPYFPLYMSAALVNALAGGCDGRRLLELALIAVSGSFVLSVLDRFLSGRMESIFKLSYSRHDAYLLDAENRFQFVHLEDPEVALMRRKIASAMSTTTAGLMKVPFQLQDTLTSCLNVIVSAALTVSLFRAVVRGDFPGLAGFVNSPWPALAVAAVILLSAWASVKLSARATGEQMEAFSNAAAHNLMYDAHMKLKGPDMYMFGLNELTLHDYKEYMIHPSWEKACEKSGLLYHIRLQPLNALLKIVVFLFTAAKVWTGAIGIGGFILYQGAVQKFVESASSAAARLGVLRDNNRYLQDTFSYLDLPNDMYQGGLAVEKRDDIDYEIEFRDVSFRYPRRSEWALRHVNLKFKIGDKLAIVGENGSGKTTFIKLLCRLYDPTEGKILLNGIDVTRYRYDEYMSLFSVAFQDYSLFGFTIAENVAASGQFEEDRVLDCLNRVGLGRKLAGLEKGIHTHIGRDYENDGVDFSGGELQKIALARALYKDAPFVILDEPTAALDPMAEAEIYTRFNDIARDKTSVYISHRLSSCKFCDEIAVFQNGRIVQMGSHDELAADESGPYYALWHAQAQYYTQPASAPPV